MRTRVLKHRNSQKRIYIPEAGYFITCATEHRIPCFKKQIFCEAFLANLKICQRLKGFKLYGYFLGYDHFHMLMKPNHKWNYSEIMRSLKKNVSHNINHLIGLNEGANNYSRLPYRGMLNQFRNQFAQKYPDLQKISHPIFRWQKSFHDHYIRNERDFFNHLNYILINPIKHGMPGDWPYVWLDDQWENIDPP